MLDKLSFKNKKVTKIICLTLTLLLLLPFASCKDNKEETEENSSFSEQTEKPEEVTTAPVEETEKEDNTDIPNPPKEDKPVFHKLNSKTPGIKILGVRNLEDENKINADWGCSGIEFKIKLSSGSIRFNVTASDLCYYRAYADGIPVMNGETPYFTVSSSSTILLQGIAPGEHLISIMKVTGYTLARSEINSVTFAGEIVEEAPKDNDTYIEFIGDSITCGWGTIGEHKWNYTDQDGTLAHPYLIAKALDADYSMTALSGQGLFCGNPGFPKGYMYASALKNDKVKYGFKRKADLVVLNIGENDAGKTTQEKFKEAYSSLIQAIKTNNGSDCKIICVYNVMSDPFGRTIREVCKEMGGEISGIYCIKLDRTTSTIAGGHPTIEEHKQYAEVLIPIIKEILTPFESSLKVVEDGDGNLDTVPFPKA